MEDLKLGILIDAFGKNEDTYAIFKDVNTEKIIWKRLPRCYYFLKRLSEERAKTTEPKTLSDIWRYRTGFTYEESKFNSAESIFEVIRCNVKNEAAMIKRLGNKNDIYDSFKDNTVHTLRENRLELYELYEWKESAEPVVYGKAYDPRDLIQSYSQLNQVVCSPTERFKKLTRMVVSITVATSIHPMKIPRFDALHESALKKKQSIIEFIGGIHPIVEISCKFKVDCDSETNDQEKTFKSTQESNLNDFNSSDQPLIIEFLEFFKKCDADVLEIQNFTKIHYMYQRCKYLDEKKYSDGLLCKKFLESINRTPKPTGNTESESEADVVIDVSDLENFMFPEFQANVKKYKNPRTESPIKTRTFLNLDDYSKECQKFPFQNAILGRIVLNHYLFNQDEEDIDPTDLDQLHASIQENGYLELLLDATGSIYLPARYYSFRLSICQNTLKKYRPDVFFPSSGEFGSFNQKIKVVGAIQFNAKPSIFKSDLFENKKKRICMVDYVSCYPNIFLSLNASMDVVIPREMSTVDGEIKAPCSDYINDALRFYPSEYRIGAIPYVISVLIKSREEIKELIRKREAELDGFEEHVSSDQTLKTLKIKELKFKLVSNIFYGCMAAQVGLKINPLVSPKIAQAITYSGRKYWTDLEKFLKESGCDILFGDTDGMIVAAEYSNEELKELLLNFQRGRSIFMTPIFKGELTALITKTQKTWVALQVTTNGNFKFINKGVITKIKPLIHRELNKEILIQIMTDPSMDFILLCRFISIVLGNFTWDDLEMKTKFEPSIMVEKKTVSKKMIKDLIEMCYSVGSMIYDDEDREMFNENVNSVIGRWADTFGKQILF